MQNLKKILNLKQQNIIKIFLLLSATLLTEANTQYRTHLSLRDTYSKKTSLCE